MKEKALAGILQDWECKSVVNSSKNGIYNFKQLLRKIHVIESSAAEEKSTYENSEWEQNAR